MPTLAELRERRAYELRLTPDRALETLDEAETFLRERGMLTRTADSALPSLYEACHEDPYRPGAGGFADWPATKWWWAGALEERDGVYALKIHHRHKALLVTEEVAALVDPIARAELERMEAADADWTLVLRHLAQAGPSTPEDLALELGLKSKDLKGIRYPLELCGAVVSRQVVHATAGGGHEHSSVLARWDQVFPEPSGRGGIEELVVAGVRAAVVAPEREVARWFPWRWRIAPELVDRLVGEGRLARPEPGWVFVP